MCVCGIWRMFAMLDEGRRILPSLLPHPDSISTCPSCSTFLWFGSFVPPHQLSSNLSLSFFRRDLWVPSAQRPRRFWFGSVRGRGVGPLHWRGPCSLQRAIGLREPEGTQLYHPGLWLWRGTWWHQQQEIAQVRETQYSKHQAFRGPMFCVDTSQIVNLYNHRVLELMGGNVPLSAISVHCVCVLPF